MTKCEFAGCQKEAYSAGLCTTHYMRRLRTGTADDGPRARAPLEDRLWKHIEKRGPDECWPWIGGTGAHGYGLIGLGGRKSKKEAAHRVVWRLLNGPIPKLIGSHGGVIRHLCNNRLCCNPAHLALGTQAQNVEDMWNADSPSKGNARLTPEQVEAIRKDTRSSRQIAPIYGVSDGHIRSIRQKRAWKGTT